MKTWTEAQLIQYFRQKFQTRVLLEVICLICVAMILLAGIFQGWWLPFLIFVGLLGITLVLLVLYHLNILTEHPEKIIMKEKLFRRSGSPKVVAGMLETLSQNLIYNDSMVSMSNEYIMVNGQPETLTHVDDLLIIWPSEVVKTDSSNTSNSQTIIIGYKITWYNIYGEKFQVQYGNNAKNRIETIMLLIKQEFPWVYVGKKSFLGEFLRKKVQPLPRLEYRTEMESVKQQVADIREAKVVKHTNPHK